MTDHDILAQLTDNRGESDLSDLLESDLLNQCDYYTYDTLSELNHNKERNFKILHLNIHSLHSKLDKLKYLLDNLKLSNHEIDIILLCETFMNDFNKNKCRIKGYCLKEYAYRQHSKFGGVAIYVKKGIKTIPRTDLKIYVEGQLETCFIEIVTEDKKRNIIVGELYRVPGTNVKNYIEQFDVLLNKLKLEQKEIVLGTDQNIDFLKINQDKKSSELLDVSLNNGILPTITRPTRVTHSTSTLIDNIYISHNLCKSYHSAIITTDISDHFPCLTMLSTKKIIKNDYIEFRSRKLNPNKLRKISEHLSYTEWNCLNSLETQDAYTKFEEVITTAINKYAPEQTHKVKQNNINEPWMTRGILISSKRIHKLFLQCIKRDKQDIAYINYVKHRNKLNSIKRKAKMAYYKNEIIKYKNDSKKLWKVINDITGKCRNKLDSTDYININGIKTYNKEIIANEFCKFFSKVGSNLADNIKTSNKAFHEYFNIYNQDSIFLTPTNRFEIEKILSDMKNKSSFGPDMINNIILKNLKSIISHPLEIIFNKSITTGIVPSQLKHAHVLPIFKGNGSHDLNNFRPISLLNCTSKILEKIIHKRLYTFIENRNLFSPLQFGFRKQKSTKDAIIAFLSRLITNLDKNEYCLGVFVDLSKAFDTIDHDILLKKLDKFGVRGIANIWFKNYLTARQQSVRINKDNSNEFISSESQTITHGIPQGSILGPVLFILYIADICTVTNGSAISFADDTTILIHNKSFEDLYISAYNDVINLIDYFNANKLSINLTKTKYILFKPNIRNQQRLNQIPNLIVNGIQIDKVESIKFLGVLIDQNLSWKLQINNILNKLNHSFYVLNSSKRKLPLTIMKLLYNAHVMSHISYGNLAWGSMINATEINKISKLLNKILKTMTNRRAKNNEMDRIYKELECLKFSDITELELSIFSYKLNNNMIPPSIISTLNTTPRPYNTRNRNIPRIHKHRTKLYNNSFLAKFNMIWTRLPERLKNSSSLKNFTREFKRHKLNEY